MSRFAAIALSALMPFAATPVRADCHWAWHCDRTAGCGFVPFCDAPTDTPPPLRGARLPGQERAVPLDPAAHAGRKPLQGYKPENPPPAGPDRDRHAPGSVDTPCAPQEGSQAAPQPRAH